MNSFFRKIKSFLKFLFFRIKYNHHIKNSKSFSQEGEDLILLNYFKNKKNGFYVDVGAFHPFRINNTYLLYKKGFRGINIDISASSIDLFNLARPDDININIGASDKVEEKNFYSKKNLSFHNTLVKSLADASLEKHSKIFKIFCKPLDQIIEKTCFYNTEIDFLNIDAEGYDYKVLLGLNLKKYLPKIICIEISPLVNIENENYEETEIYKYLISCSYNLVWKGSNSFIFKLNKFENNLSV